MEKRLNMLDLKDGLYLVDKSYGKVYRLERGKSAYGDDSFFYHGKLHKGAIEFYAGKDMSQAVPAKGNWDYGFTFEGKAKNLFEVENALVKENPQEGRKFAYINDDSVLKYTGTAKEEHDFYVRVFDKVDGELNYRWVVIYVD